MTERKTDNPIERAAAEWFARMDRDDVTQQDRDQLNAWLAADSRHQGAYVRLQALWVKLDRVGALSNGTVGSFASPVPKMPASLIRRRFLQAGGALAASLATSFVVWKKQSEIYNTQIGEVRQVPLNDGSRVAINTSSRIQVVLEPGQRIVRLSEGEAWFEVAKDPTRPFIVEAGSIRVRAIGTAFSVLIKDKGAEILVSEGVVEAWSVKGKSAARPLRLSVGSRAFVKEEAIAETTAVRPEQVGRSLAWREGNIVLDGETLFEAAEKFNRYNELKIIVNDPALGQRQVVGYFNANNPKDFAEAITSLLDAQIKRTPDSILLEAKPPG